MRILKNVAMVAAMAALTSCGNQVSEVKSLETELDSVSYALGLDMALKIKANFPEANKDLFTQGYKNGVDSTNLLLNQKDVSVILRNFFQKQQLEKRKQQQEQAIKMAEEKYADVKKEGIAFLEENKSKKGVITTDSGLQYMVLKEGKGVKPAATSKVKIHYHGTLTDGTVFDSSVERKKPIENGVNQFVKGFSEGLQLMNVGSKYKFFIPQELAYGATPRPGKIKPFMPIVFEVELLEIIK